MFEVVKRIEELRKERDWSIYKLAIESGLTQQTIHAWYDSKKSSIPSIATLETVCKALDITLSEFFAEGNLIEVTLEMEKLHKKLNILSDDDRTLIGVLVNKLAK